MSLLDPISEKDAAALGKAFGDALGPYIQIGIRDAVALALEKLDKIQPEVVLKLNK